MRGSPSFGCAGRYASRSGAASDGKVQALVRILLPFLQVVPTRQSSLLQAYM